MEEYHRLRQSLSMLQFSDELQMRYTCTYSREREREGGGGGGGEEGGEREMEKKGKREIGREREIFFNFVKVGLENTHIFVNTFNLIGLH